MWILFKYCDGAVWYRLKCYCILLDKDPNILITKLLLLKEKEEPPFYEWTTSAYNNKTYTLEN